MREPTERLRDILETIAQVVACVDGIAHEAFRPDRMREPAVIRQIGIVGEASRELSEPFRTRHPEIP